MIRLKKVRVHNLKGVDLELETGQLIVFTGVSGSGKSSLAFQTIYVEGQRRYIESLSHQARRFLGDLPKPEAESISGISPTIAIEQKTAGRTPRSTVGTMTGIYDFLRVLFARVGVPHCPVSKEPVAAQSREKIVAQVEGLPAKKMIFLAPFARGKKGEFKEEFAELLSKGFMRLRVDGAWVELGGIEGLDPKAAHDVDIVVDRLADKDHSRVAEAVNSALELGKGFFSVWDPEREEETVFSQFAHSVKSGLSYGPLEPHDFSFNHPSGMCPTCHGIGITAEFDLSKIIDPSLSISEDCCKVGSSYQTVRYGNIYDNLAKIYKFSVKKAWKDLPKQAKEVFLYGTEQKWTRMNFVHPVKKSRWEEYVQWKGVLSEARERLTAAKSDAYRKNMAELMTEGTCSACSGSRIKPYPAAAQLGGKTIAELTAMPLSDVLTFFQKLKLTPLEAQIAGELLKEICERLQFLIDVGISYLALDRTSPSLSGGESQRVRLASQIGAGLVGAIYVLDEPSIGLHPVDHHKLIDTLKRLRDQGNTVLVVEHDADTILAADRVVDVGPGAGQHGGEILSLDDPRSITGGYLSGRLKIDIPKKRRKATKKLILTGAKHNNLKNLTVSIPLGVFVCVTGVSGSGKSSLIDDTLYPELVKRSAALKGLEQVDKVINVDQSPIGRTPRSNAATYIKLFDEIRDLFTELPESKLRGFHAGHFSFNVKEGSCSYCSGLGQVRIDMDFMEDAWVECPQCKGKRFDPEILSVKFKGKSIHDVLETDVEHALELFDSIPSIRRKLEVLSQVGLDYLTLGQSSTTLSGGEAQRIKLAKELVRPATGNTIYILDEPTTGLHFHDVKRLVEILQKLVDKGNTVLVIEHNMDLVKCADWIIDLGPGAGVHGGELIGEGTPELIAQLQTPTGRALKGLPSSPKSSKKEKIVQEIVVEKASQNNLHAVSLKIPRGQITVFTGPSGSGKSSLAFDTLYAEGQRRYIETLPAYSRAQVKQLPKPIVEKIEGLSPSIALEQKTGGLNPRSTVGTITEIYDLLRVLYAHLGVLTDPNTGKEVEHISKETIVSRILALPPGEKIQILTPVSFQKKETFEALVERLNREGFLRLRLNGKTFELDEPIPYEKHRKNEIHLSLDRLAVDPKVEKRLYEAVELAQEGVIIVAREKEDLVFPLSAHRRLTPQHFSFNHDAGMCLECQGLGVTYGAHLDADKKFKKLSILDLADRLFKDKGTSGAYKILEKYFDEVGESPEIILNGGPEVPFKKGLTLRWLGLHPVLANAARMANGEIREALLPMMQATTCSVCKGTRLNETARHVRINRLSISDLCALELEKAHAFMQKLTPPDFLKETHSQIGKFFEFLLSIGLHYLSLDRSAPTLSGGELQRIRLARQLGSGLTSCLYVLDEPTIGLHPYNNELLNRALHNLRDLGNTLILVEHDPMTIRAADYLFDFGPKAGREGGRITAHGTLPEIKENPHSLTGAYLSGRKKIPIPATRRSSRSSIRIENATLHNLKNITVEIPKSAITCLTGVSGSGKSSLLSYLTKNKEFDKIISIDQSPIGQTSRADVSTYTDIQPLIRAHYASLPLAQAKGLQPRHFSPNHLRGMCRTCWGLGYKMVDLQFLPAVRVTCEACHGQRLNPISLEVRYKGKHFGEVLQMSVEEALQWFSAIPPLAKRLEKLLEVGLPYLRLGQELVSLSGGEAQRLRLSRELAKRATGNTLYLIDEPTVGLHPEDVLKLLKIFHQLADKQNTLVIIEHNIDVIVNADYLIDLGPDAGAEGGCVMATGTPEEVSRSKTSRTAKYIQEVL
jgi:excinuclease ABC subunit A